MSAALPTRRGLPFWVLPAILPLALSLGFVAGMGLAHYRLLGRPAPSQQTPVQAGAPTPKGNSAATSPQPTLPLETATLSPAHVEPSEPTPAVVTDPPTKPTTSNGPVAGHPNPDQIYTVTNPGRPTITTIGDARTALQSDWTGIALISGLEYQQMRNADNSVSLVGMLSVEQYMSWEATLRRDPAALQHWLQAAATLVLNPMQTDRFALSWALVETRASVPSWALPSEVTPLADGRFLVVRYLAGTTGLGQPTVEVRAAASLGSPADPSASWSRFGPQIRFDGTDIYRPSGVAPKSP
ncbi:MAG TPA: hypothetical protein VK191_14055 [Symbiobacteriaceae bacterium]|nr:hypothetical protein [Symbiobacteriaceae bacterium]